MLDNDRRELCRYATRTSTFFERSRIFISHEKYVELIPTCNVRNNRPISQNISQLQNSTKPKHTSRQTRLNDIAPLARGTEFADMLRVKELVVAGANAAAELMIVAKKEAVFMIEICVCSTLSFL